MSPLIPIARPARQDGEGAGVIDPVIILLFWAARPHRWDPGGRRESVLSEEVLSHFRADSQHLGLILWVAPELTSPEPNDLFVAQQHQRIDGDEP